MTNKELFQTSPEYRAKVIRELERKGSIVRLTKKDFGHLVYG